MEVEINFWAVLLATASSMVVGSFWYARSVFGNYWIKVAKVDAKQLNSKSVTPLILALVMGFITAYVLAHISFLSNEFFEHSFLKDALTTAFWLWAGLTAARLVVHDSFEGRPKGLTLLNIGHEFVTIMIMGLIIGLMKP